MSAEELGRPLLRGLANFPDLANIVHFLTLNAQVTILARPPAPPERECLESVVFQGATPAPASADVALWVG